MFDEKLLKTLFWIFTILIAIAGWGLITFISYLLSFVQLASNT